MKILHIIIFLILIISIRVLFSFYQNIIFKNYENIKIHRLNNFVRLRSNEINNLLIKSDNGINQNIFSQGKKLAYNEIKKLAPTLVEQIESEKFRKIISNSLGEEVYLSNKNDSDRLFTKFYFNQNDNIGWHYDTNFSGGRRYTINIPLYIEKCNTCRLQYKNSKGKTINVNDKLNELYIYEGDKIFHRVTNQTKNCKRLVIIIPMYNVKDFNLIGKIKTNLKLFFYKFFQS